MQRTCEWVICIRIVSWSYERSYSWNWCNCAQVYWNRSQSWERKMKGLRSCLKTSQLLADVLVLNPKSWLLKLKFNYQPPASCTNQIWGAITSESWDVDSLTFIGELRMKDTCMICSTIETCWLKRASMIEGNILDPCCRKHCCYKCAKKSLVCLSTQFKSFLIERSWSPKCWLHWSNLSLPCITSKDNMAHVESGWRKIYVQIG
jgi:hypothetical protein